MPLHESVDWLRAEMRRLDLLLHREILRLRASYQLSLDEFRGLYISDEQVDQLVAQSGSLPGDIPTAQALTDCADALRRENAERLAPELPWACAASAFGLSPAEQDVLLMAVAPEFDGKYETLYAYLNNDVTRKWPTCDLALRLFAEPGGEASLRRLLLPDAPLFREGLLRALPHQPDRPAWPATGFRAAPILVHYIAGHDGLEPSLAACIERRPPDAPLNESLFAPAVREWLRRVVARWRGPSNGDRLPSLILEGRAGSGRRTAAEFVCRAIGRPLLHVDFDALRGAGQALPSLVRDLLLYQRLHGAGLCFHRCEALFDSDGRPLPESARLIRQLAQSDAPLFLAFEPGAAWRPLVQDLRYLPCVLNDPDYPMRMRLWKESLAPECIVLADAEIEQLAGRFVLTPGQIRRAVAAAADARDTAAPSGASSALPALLDAARAQTTIAIGRLAAKVKLVHDWDDLILPVPTLGRVKDFAAAVRHRHVVYSDWGFQRRVAPVAGVHALFAGASGTGKTMAAGVVARALNLDLYRIDLSAVVSKYIGETEKQLDRLFTALQAGPGAAGNAILFFDEADALFGRRSEVKDAHDRYANIEVAYLLQKIEEFEGIVILASNLSRNIDEAFARRLQYVIDFPMPDERQRERIWRAMFPPEAPLGGDVDFAFLARQFPLAGGDIRNVALDAAFQAAEDGRVIRMEHLVHAMARQTRKQGKVPSAAEFRHYYAMVSESV